MRKHGHAEVFRITGARQRLADDVRGRQRRYVISMSVRTLSVILAATLWNVERHVAIVALVLGLVLPYVAVVIANAGRENAPSLPPTFVPAPSRPMIAPVPEQPADQPPPDSPTESTTGSAAESGRRPTPSRRTSRSGSRADPWALNAQEKLRSIMMFRCTALRSPWHTLCALRIPVGATETPGSSLCGCPASHWEGVVRMADHETKRGRRWTGFERWQVGIALMGLFVAIVGCAGQLVQ